MNYTNIYNNLIQKATTRTLNGYKESHHIIPRCMDGSDDKTNLVDLTPEEHFLAHQLLVKMYPDNQKLIFALVIMHGKNPTTNKLFGWHRRKLAETQKILKTGKAMKPRSAEHTQKIADANRGRKNTPEANTRISEAKKGCEPWNKGKPGSQVAWNKGKPTGIATKGCFKKGRTPWNKGLTKDTDERVATYGNTRTQIYAKNKLTDDDSSI